MKPTDAMLLRNTITEPLSDTEHQLFILACDRSGLDPFARQIYWMKREGRLVIEASIDGFRLTAERTGEYAGQVGPYWCGPDGKWLSIWTALAPPTAARVGIIRKDFRKPVWGKAVFAEYDQGGRFWREMPTNQIAKCAEALAFRKAFPAKFSGLYTPEEMVSGSSAVTPLGTSDSQAQSRQLALVAQQASGVYPDHGGEPGNPSAPAVPLPLQPFVDQGFNRRNVEACFRFIEGELENLLGEEGRALFRVIHSRMPRIFKTREACQAGTLACWLELWKEVERAQAERRAA
jgi:phage recombination protein Bet